MANLNKVMLIGRLTRDPETRTFGNGGKVVKVGFAVNNSKKTQQGWQDEPVFIDLEAFNNGQRRLADQVGEFRKGQQVFIEGHLRLNEWVGQDGTKRSKLLVRIDKAMSLDARQGNGGQARPPQARQAPPVQQRQPAPNDTDDGRYDDDPAGDYDGGDIPW